MQRDYTVSFTANELYCLLLFIQYSISPKNHIHIHHAKYVNRQYQICTFHMNHIHVLKINFIGTWSWLNVDICELQFVTRGDGGGVTQVRQLPNRRSVSTFT